MTKVETTRFVDDISGDEADETVDFGLDGRTFEIDLTSVNARRLRDGLAPYLAAARAAETRGARKARTGTSASPAGASAAPTGSGSDAATREHNRAVRVWAQENGFTVSERGRIPAEVADAYRRGEPASAVAEPEPVAADPEPVTDEPSDAPAPGRPQAPAVEFSG